MSGGEESKRRGLAEPGRLLADHGSGRPWARPLNQTGCLMITMMTPFFPGKNAANEPPKSRRLLMRQEPHGVGRHKLIRQPPPQRHRAEPQQIGVEVLGPGHQRMDGDADRLPPLAQAFHRPIPGGIVVTRDIEPDQRRRKR